jgi:hypothetical protein
LHLMHWRTSAQRAKLALRNVECYQASLRPMRRALRIVRIIVDIAGRRS